MTTARLPGPGTFSFKIVGASHYQSALEGICGGRTYDGVDCVVESTLTHENDNPYDEQAIRVDIQGTTVGYLDRSDARQFRARLAEAGYPGITATCSARIRGGWDRGGDDQGYFGVRIDLPTGPEAMAEQQRQSREHKTNRAQSEAQEERARAAREVESYESTLENLLSVHKESRTQIDWRQLATSPEPPKPTRPTKPPIDHYHEEMAKKALDRYTPSAVDRLFFRVDRKRRQLEEAIQLGREKDREAYSATCAKLSVQWHREVAESQRHVGDWLAITKLAGRIVNHDAKAFAEAIVRMNGFTDLRQLGAGLKFGFAETIAEIMATLRGDEVVPRECKALTKTGKVSVKVLAAGKRMDIFRRHVCSCVFGIVRETFSLLPVEKCIVTVHVKRRNSKTGQEEKVPILSVAVPRSVSNHIAWEHVEPADAIKSFDHRMNFKRTKGFEAIEPINRHDVPRLEKK